jgi:hypothetical protein
LTCPHPLGPPKQLAGNDYVEIVTSWINNHPKWTVNETSLPLLTVLCNFHAQLQDAAILKQDDNELLDELRPLRSLHNLWRGVEMIFDTPTLDILKQNYLGRTGDLSLKRYLVAAHHIVCRSGSLPHERTSCRWLSICNNNKTLVLESSGE